jgi:uncharacterized protein (TIGR03790 family)
MWRSSLLALRLGFMAVALGAPPARATDPSQRTADLPDSWLVLYNLNNPDSVAWAQWYRQVRGIPESHMMGLAAALDEHLPDLAAVQAQIIGPVHDLLTADPQLEQSIMGIVLGYDLPGHYGTPLVNPDTGGFSVADALQDMTDDDRPPGPFDYQGGQRGYNYDCPTLSGHVLPSGGRLTKATMAANRYMVMRIDAPTLDEAMQLTERALVLEDPHHSLFGETAWYDYYDPVFPSGNHEWYWLRNAVEAPELPDLPWAYFNSHAQETPQDAFRMAIYQLTGWSAANFATSDPGSRVLAFDLNSFGAVTLRSLTAYGGLYVPNALGAGYAAGIGATGEPQCCQSPVPVVLLAALREGWTLGEAYYLSNPFNDWMWTGVGDPFLRLPLWFNEAPPLQGDVNGDGTVNLRDVAGFRACLSGPGGTSDPVCQPFDFDGDGDYDLADFAGFQRAFTGGTGTVASGDYNGDGNVDIVDYAALRECQTSMGPTTLASGCDVFDFDFDLDVDLQDFGNLQVRFNTCLAPPETVR